MTAYHQPTLTSAPTPTPTAVPPLPGLSSSCPDELEWIHCNSCFADLWSSLPAPNRRGDPPSSSPHLGSKATTAPTGLSRFAVAQCGHILCISCVTSSYNPQSPSVVHCPVCHEVVEYTPLCNENGTLLSDMNIYFAPFLPQLPQILTALEFRQRNTDSLLRFLKTKLHLQRQAIEKAAKELKSLREVQAQYSGVMEENDALKAQVNDIQRHLRHLPSTLSSSKQQPFRMPTAAASAVARPSFIPASRPTRSSSVHSSFVSHGSTNPFLSSNYQSSNSQPPNSFDSLRRGFSRGPTTPVTRSPITPRVAGRHVFGHGDESIVSYSSGARVSSSGHGSSVPQPSHSHTKNTFGLQHSSSTSHAVPSKGPSVSHPRSRSTRTGTSTSMPGRRR